MCCGFSPKLLNVLIWCKFWFVFVSFCRLFCYLFTNNSKAMGRVQWILCCCSMIFKVAFLVQMFYALCDQGLSRVLQHSSFGLGKA